MEAISWNCRSERVVWQILDFRFRNASAMLPQKVEKKYIWNTVVITVLWSILILIWWWWVSWPWKILRARAMYFLLVDCGSGLLSVNFNKPSTFDQNYEQFDTTNIGIPSANCWNINQNLQISSKNCFRENPSATFRNTWQKHLFLTFREKLPQSFRNLPQHMRFCMIAKTSWK